MFAFKGSDAIIRFRCGAEEVGSEERTAGDRTRRRRLNKLSCADWLPHDRGFVSGLPRSKNERRSGDQLITGQEGSSPGSCRWQCAPADLLLSTSSRCGRRVWSGLERWLGDAGDRQRSLSAVAARQDTARHTGEIPRGAARATTRRAADARGTEPEASATLWSAAALGNMLGVE
jgi:hypothetical protein